MEMTAVLMGIEVFSFADKVTGEPVNMTRLHLLSTLEEKEERFFGKRVALLNTTKFSEDWQDLIGQEVTLVYRMQIGSKHPRFMGIETA